MDSSLQTPVSLTLKKILQKWRCLRWRRLWILTAPAGSSAAGLAFTGASKNHETPGQLEASGQPH